MSTSTDTLAAIDLGSNSFHMIIARVVDGQLQIVDRLKDMVRLGGGLDAENNLSDESQQRALTALSMFGERLKDIPSSSVRALGTNTLRKARNSKDFLKKAEQALGHPIEIISGQEEGRIVYLGVAHNIFDHTNSNRIVVDIGGGSTEAILGKGFDVIACESLYMGCVSFSQKYFKNGSITTKRFEQAILGARQELRAIENTYPAIGWTQAIGSSGTIKSIQAVLIEEKLGTLGITLEAMHRLKERLIGVGNVNQLNLAGMNPERAPVFAGGLAILIGVFESLGIQQMQVSDFALREGAIYDLYGRTQDMDVRDVTINNMVRRYNVDEAHARRVWETAKELLGQVKQELLMDSSYIEAMLRRACMLHEVGLAISHSRYHKHGSYIVENSDMPGFSKKDQQLLWSLVRSHRRRFKPHRFANLPGDLSRQALYMAIILRLAVVLNRGRTANSHPAQINFEVELPKLRLTFPEGWLESAPLMREDLTQEQLYLRDAGFKFKFK